MNKTKVFCIAALLLLTVTYPGKTNSEELMATTMEQRLSAAELNVEEVKSVAPPVSIVVKTSLAIPSEVDGSFKTYMDYRTITDEDSVQWKMQQDAVTDESGFRKYHGRYMVAMGSYYTTECGKELDITLDSGLVIPVVIGDLKQNKHTDETNRYIPKNGNIVEFIVDKDLLNNLSRDMGDVSYSGLEGAVVQIEELQTTLNTARQCQSAELQ